MQHGQDLGQDLREDLRLDSEDEDVGLARHLHVLADDPDAELARERGGLGLLRVRREEARLPTPVRREDSPQERGPHVPRADDADFSGGHVPSLLLSAVGTVPLSPR